MMRTVFLVFTLGIISQAIATRPVNSHSLTQYEMATKWKDVLSSIFGIRGRDGGYAVCDGHVLQLAPPLAGENGDADDGAKWVVCSDLPNSLEFSGCKDTVATMLAVRHTHSGDRVGFEKVTADAPKEKRT